MVRSTVGQSILGALDYAMGGDARRLARDDQLQVTESRRLANQAATRELRNMEDSETFNDLLSRGLIKPVEGGGYQVSNVTSWRPDQQQAFFGADSSYFRNPNNPDFEFTGIGASPNKGQYVLLGTGGRPITENATSDPNDLVRQFSSDEINDVAQSRLNSMLANAVQVNPGSQQVLTQRAVNAQVKLGRLRQDLLDSLDGITDADPTAGRTVYEAFSNMTYPELLEVAEEEGLDLTAHFQTFGQPEESDTGESPAQERLEDSLLSREREGEPDSELTARERFENTSNRSRQLGSLSDALDRTGGSDSDVILRPPQRFVDERNSASGAVRSAEAEIIRLENEGVLPAMKLMNRWTGDRRMVRAQNQLDNARRRLEIAQADYDENIPTAREATTDSDSGVSPLTQQGIDRREASRAANNQAPESTSTASPDTNMDPAIVDVIRMLEENPQPTQADISYGARRAQELGVRTPEDVARLVDDADRRAIMYATAAIYAGDPAVQSTILDRFGNYMRTGSFSTSPTDVARVDAARVANAIRAQGLQIDVSQLAYNQAKDLNAFKSAVNADGIKIETLLVNNNVGSEEHNEGMIRLSGRIASLRSEADNARRLALFKSTMGTLKTYVIDLASKESDGILGYFADFWKGRGARIGVDFGPERFKVVRSRTGALQRIEILGSNLQETKSEISARQLTSELGTQMLEYFAQTIEAGQVASQE